MKQMRGAVRSEPLFKPILEGDRYLKEGFKDPSGCFWITKSFEGLRNLNQDFKCKTCNCFCEPMKMQVFRAKNTTYSIFFFHAVRTMTALKVGCSGRQPLDLNVVRENQNNQTQTKHKPTPKKTHKTLKRVRSTRIRH